MHRSSKRKAATAMPSSACNPGGRKKAAVSSDGGSLPDEMVMEVLLRLPVKSILRFRAVCRSWAALFSTDVFRSLHIADTASPKLLFVSPTTATSSTKVYSCSPSERKDDDALLFALDSACGSSMQLLTPAPCHGLSLLYDDTAPAYYICNAATRAVTRLPTFLHRATYTCAGFGFDARARKYKVVRLSKGTRHEVESVRCEVYTHGGGDGDCWRPPTGGGVPLGLRRFAHSAIANAALNNLPPVFANGSLHLVVQPNSFFRRPRAAVISFSLSEETFSFVGPPPFWTPEMYSSTASSLRETGERPFMPGTLGEHLVQMDNQLCMVRDLRYNPSGGCILEIWKLPDSTSSAWSLNHRINLFGRVARDLCRTQVVRVMGSTGNAGSRKKMIIATSEHIIFDKFQKKVCTYDLGSQSLETILSVTETRTSLQTMTPSSRFGLFEESLAPVSTTPPS
ncbi:F-box/kelch-repeat protein At3g23880 [Brachypodium distachyon]|uniref:F-box domain-containing protein n=1 Tax=Brachypodium distachyon TaxID=15368 RepID=I1J063_BRADI|nr:F-box/kelch-repeat protein At3g23880 [Brachypodium distachyon]KQJ83845.1 hypothetical protein BRADI_5g17140v3 [Brachypodium distachyon]|eukprot:XP_003581470.1 F-box/kelch-repeat protein At3g23880 [Brachypodium distachyon]